MEAVKKTTPIEPKISEATLCLVITFRRTGFSRKIDPKTIVREGLDTEAIRGSRLLFDPKTPEFEAITKFDNALGSWIEKRALPVNILKGGIHLIPARLSDEVDDKIETALADRTVLVEKLANKYDTLRAWCEAKNGKQFTDEEFPARERFTAEFALDWQFTAFSTPENLKTISVALYEKEAAKAEKQWEAITSEVREGLREGFIALIAHAVERLTPDKDGKPKRFYDSTVTNLNEFLDVFEKRNVTNDADLQKLVAEARKVIKGIDPEELRVKDAPVRERVREKFEQINQQCAVLVRKQPSRAIRLVD